jgi:hypothetical protein
LGKLRFEAVRGWVRDGKGSKVIMYVIVDGNHPRFIAKQIAVVAYRCVLQSPHTGIIAVQNKEARQQMA